MPQSSVEPEGNTYLQFAVAEGQWLCQKEEDECQQRGRVCQRRGAGIDKWGQEQKGQGWAGVSRGGQGWAEVGASSGGSSRGGSVSRGTLRWNNKYNMQCSGM